MKRRLILWLSLCLFCHFSFGQVFRNKIWDLSFQDYVCQQGTECISYTLKCMPLSFRYPHLKQGFSVGFSTITQFGYFLDLNSYGLDGESLSGVKVAYEGMFPLSYKRFQPVIGYSFAGSWFGTGKYEVSPIELVVNEDGSISWVPNEDRYTQCAVSATAYFGLSFFVSKSFALNAQAGWQVGWFDHPLIPYKIGSGFYYSFSFSKVF